MCVYVSKIKQDNSKRLSTNFVEMLGGLGRMTSHSSSDFGGNPDHEADTGILKRIFFLLRGVGKLCEFC